ncbi:MAG: Ig-like domain-containing protein [Ruminiclostridium sp.]|nr:Ig-like domain-containing protein [Ruminiclostridium sp.]
MTKFKKLTAILLSAVMLVCCFAVQAGAESIEDTAKAITSGTTKSFTLTGASDKRDYKIVLSEAGKLKLNITSKVPDLEVSLYNTNGERLTTEKTNITTGSEYDQQGKHCVTNKTVEKFSGTIIYSLKKGTYYLRLLYSYGHGEGKVTLKATYPSSETDSSSKISCITIPMKVGDTMQLSTDAGSTGITWSSSKSSVAAVSSAGKVTAKKAGTTVITAKSGSSTAKIQIKVTK